MRPGEVETRTRSSISDQAIVTKVMAEKFEGGSICTADLLVLTCTIKLF